jgi:hypothetical protein
LWASHGSLARKLVLAGVLTALALLGLAPYADAPSLIPARGGFDMRVLPMALARFPQQRRVLTLVGRAGGSACLCDSIRECAPRTG